MTGGGYQIPVCIDADNEVGGRKILRDFKSFEKRIQRFCLPETRIEPWFSWSPADIRLDSLESNQVPHFRGILRNYRGAGEISPKIGENVRTKSPRNAYNITNSQNIAEREVSVWRGNQRPLQSRGVNETWGGLPDDKSIPCVDILGAAGVLLEQDKKFVKSSIILAERAYLDIKHFHAGVGRYENENRQSWME